MAAVAFVFAVFFIALVFCVYNSISIVVPLLIGLLGFMALSRQRGYGFGDIFKMMREGVGKSAIVLEIFVLVGLITATWRASGTIACIVYYGIEFMNEQFFILFAFILSCIVSFLLGTCFGTVGTIGVVLMVLARAGGMNADLVAGALIAGAFFGDRCSPMSSSANLVAIVTRTNLYTNIRNMMYSGMPAMLLTLAIYTVFSFTNPLSARSTPVSGEILQLFDIGIVAILPTVIVLGAALMRVDVRIAMALSIGTAAILALAVQGCAVTDLIRYSLSGYETGREGFFAGIIKGGGLLSMVVPSLIVLISSAYAGIFAGTGMLKDLYALASKASLRLGVYMVTTFTGIITAAFSCNQTLSVMLTQQIQEQSYEKQGLSKYRIAVDLENTAIVIAGLIPWNIAGAFPAAALSVGTGFMIYAVFLYILPLTGWMMYRLPGSLKEE